MIGADEKGTTLISARSLGEVNVQTIMEKLGGGGHLATAGAQLKLTKEETVEEVRAAYTRNRLEQDIHWRSSI